ncbi:Casein kinase I isoform delta-like protein [Hordeum vulgare]|nr:Casein kinase I isoform delta-like protein [Hordeum vulgare]
MVAISKDMADEDCKMLVEYVAMDSIDLLTPKVVKREMVIEEAAEIGPAVRCLDPLFDPFCIWGNDVFMNISEIKKLRKIVKINKLVMKNNKMFVCTMKNTLVNDRMFVDEYVSNHLYSQEVMKIFIQHP